MAKMGYDRKALAEAIEENMHPMQKRIIRDALVRESERVKKAEIYSGPHGAAEKAAHLAEIEEAFNLFHP